MGELQRQYRMRLDAVLGMKAQRRVKVMLLQSLLQEMNQLQHLYDQTSSSDLSKSRPCYEVLSTAVSECPSVVSMGDQLEKQVEELQQRIISLRMVKFEQNEHIQALEQQLEEKERTAIARSEYNDHLKRKMLVAMQAIHSAPVPVQKEKSVLNKSIDAVAGILTFRWW